jgi:hypothetical protein
MMLRPQLAQEEVDLPIVAAALELMIPAMKLVTLAPTIPAG